MSGQTWWRWLAATVRGEQRARDEEAPTAAREDLPAATAAAALAGGASAAADRRQLGAAARQVQRTVGNQGVQRLLAGAAPSLSNSEDLLPVAQRYEQSSPAAQHEMLEALVASFLRQGGAMQTELLGELVAAQRRFGHLLLIQHLSLRLMPTARPRAPTTKPDDGDDDND